MTRSGCGYRVLALMVAVMLIVGLMSVTVSHSEGLTICGNEQAVGVHTLVVGAYDVSQLAGSIEEPPVQQGSDIPISPDAQLEDRYSDSAENEVPAPVTEVTGSPDDVRYSVSGTGTYVRGSGSTWGVGSGTIMSVEIAAEWSAAGLVDDGAILRYFDDSLGNYGATASISDPTNYPVDNTLYLDITADKATWDWPDLNGIHPEIAYDKVGGPDGGTINVDAVWIRVQYDDVAVTFTIPITAGWNLISVPFIQADTSVTSVLDDDGGNTFWNYVQCYDAADGDHWKTYATFKPSSVNDLADIDNKMGVWVHITDPGTDNALATTGAPPSSTDITLLAGWNLVGYPCLEGKSVADALAGVPYDGIECFDEGAAYRLTTMLPTEMMEPGNGYWIKVTSDCLWTIGDTTPPVFGGLVSATDAGVGNTIDLMWNPASDPSYPITYNIYMSAVSGGQNFAAPDYMTNQTNFQVTGLTNGQEYFFVVRAEDSAGNEDANTIERSAIPTTEDIIPPEIILTVPADSETGVLVGQDVIITFSESIDTLSFAYTCNPDPLGWS
ncbi:MAG: hypothetical protein KAX31_07145, partial [Thermoplasmata archaeon]|nr:hypothetical protein [Thermoplasmata archaeon]